MVFSISGTGACEAFIVHQGVDKLTQSAQSDLCIKKGPRNPLFLGSVGKHWKYTIYPTFHFLSQKSILACCMNRALGLK